MKCDTFLIKYAEIGTKGKNRYVFEDILCKRIRVRLKELGSFEVKRDYGRIYVYANSEYDYDDVMERLTKIFGIVGVCPVLRTTLDLSKEDGGFDDIAETLIKHFENEFDSFDFSFKMFVKRNNKSFPITSMEMDARLGEVLLKKYEDEGLHVDIHTPDIKVYVEIRDQVYIYSKIIPGPGGLPTGTNGRGLALLSGGIDSPVATYMIAKRGVEMEAVYFNAPPYTSERAKDKVKKLGTICSEYAGPIRLHIVNFTDMQLCIYDKCPHDELTIIMKRYMYRMAEEIAKKEGLECIVTGESIGQVSSQTAQSLLVINEVINEIPVYRPLIGMDKQEIINLSQKIDTYETSILPYEDCCTIFVAKHPVTKPHLDVIKRSEEKLKGVIEPIYEKAMSTIETVVLK